MQPGYAGATTNLQIVLNTQKNPYLDQVTQKTTCQMFLPKKILEWKISDPKKSFDHPRHMKSGVPPLGSEKCLPHNLPTWCCTLHQLIQQNWNNTYTVSNVMSAVQAQQQVQFLVCNCEWHEHYF